MGNGHQSCEVHPVPRLCCGLQDRALPAAARDVAQAHRRESDTGIKVDVSTYPVRCNQCKDAPCVKVCPTEASHQRADGVVVIDSNKCIGCRYCVIACPYQNRTFLSKDKNPGYFPGFPETKFEKKGKKIYPHTVGTTEKCNFCVERIDTGMEKGTESRASIAMPPRPASILARPEP